MQKAHRNPLLRPLGLILAFCLALSPIQTAYAMEGPNDDFPMTSDSGKIFDSGVTDSGPKKMLKAEAQGPVILNNKPYATIQAAVNAAQSGDIIEIISSVYSDTVEVPDTKELTFILDDNVSWYSAKGGAILRNYGIVAIEGKANSKLVASNGCRTVILNHITSHNTDTSLTINDLKIDCQNADGSKAFSHGIENDGALKADNLQIYNQGYKGDAIYTGRTHIEGRNGIPLTILKNSRIEDAAVCIDQPNETGHVVLENCYLEYRKSGCGLLSNNTASISDTVFHEKNGEPAPAVIQSANKSYYLQIKDKIQDAKIDIDSITLDNDGYLALQPAYRLNGTQTSIYEEHLGMSYTAPYEILDKIKIHGAVQNIVKNRYTLATEETEHGIRHYITLMADITLDLPDDLPEILWVNDPPTAIGAVSNGKITYETSDSKIASVDTDGNITPMAVGKVTITVKAGDKTESFEIEVKERPLPETILKLLSENPMRFTMDDPKPRGVEIESNAAVTFESADSTIAEVGPDGMVTPIGHGETIIKIKAGTKELKVKIIVDQETSLSVKVPDTDNLYPGDRIPIEISSDKPFEVIPKDPNIVTYDPNTGELVATCPGTTEIEITSGGKTEMIEITVKTPAIELPKGPIVLYPNTEKASVDIKAKVEPENAKIVWSSDDPFTIEVSNNGAVSALRNGQAVITARIDGAQTEIEIIAKDPEISIRPLPDILWPGQSYILDITCPVEYKVKSSDTRVIEIDPATGKIMTKKPGMAVIEIKAGNTVKTLELIVGTPSVEINGAPKTLYVDNEPSIAVLTAKAKPEGVVRWSSSDPSILTVDPDGTIKAIAPGKAVITAKTEWASARVEIEVLKNKDQNTGNNGNNDSKPDIKPNPSEPTDIDQDNARPNPRPVENTDNDPASPAAPNRNESTQATPDVPENKSLEHEPETHAAPEFIEIPNQPAPKDKLPLASDPSSDFATGEKTEQNLSWAVLDLLIMALMLAMTIRAMSKNNGNSIKNEKENKRTIASTALTILGAVLFVLINDLTKTMVLAKPSTVLFLILFLVQTLVESNCVEKIRSSR